MSRSMRMALAFAVAAAAGACAHNVPAPALRPQLTGHWMRARGDTTTTPALADTMSGRVPAVPVGDRDGRRGGRGGYGEGREGSERAHVDPEALGAAAAAVSRGLAHVNIAQTDSTVHLDFADGSYFDMPTDGRRRQDIWRNIGRIESSARWTEAGLVFERKIEEEGPAVTVKQTYARAPGADRVTVTTEIKGQSPRPITFRRVLVPATS